MNRRIFFSIIGIVIFLCSFAVYFFVIKPNREYKYLEINIDALRTSSEGFWLSHFNLSECENMEEGYIDCYDKKLNIVNNYRIQFSDYVSEFFGRVEKTSFSKEKKQELNNIGRLLRDESDIFDDIYFNVTRPAKDKLITIQDLRKYNDLSLVANDINKISDDLTKIHEDGQEKINKLRELQGKIKDEFSRVGIKYY